MDVIATPVFMLPQAAGNTVVTDTPVGDTVAIAPVGDIFGDLLAKQLDLVMSELQLPEMADVKPGMQADAPVDKVALDAAELAAQLQAAMVAQPDVNGIAFVQPPVVQSPIAIQIAEVAAEEAVSQKIGEIGEQQRQVIAVVAPELAATKTVGPAELQQIAKTEQFAQPQQIAKTEKIAQSQQIAKMEQVAAGKDSSSTDKGQLATIAPQLAAAGRTQAMAAHELDAMRHGETTPGKQQSLQSVMSADGQSAPAAFAQMLSSQQNPAVSQSGSTLPSAAIQAPVSSSAWGAGLGDKVVWMVGQQHQGVELHLNPPALGPLEIRVNMSDGQANLSFMTQHLPVREAIEAATSRLREMLGDSGISMGSVSVNVGTFAQQQSSAQSENGRFAPEFRQTDNAPGFFPGASVVAIRSLHGNGMVDTFA